MKRRSFLKLIGLGAAAPATALAMPENVVEEEPKFEHTQVSQSFFVQPKMEGSEMATVEVDFELSSGEHRQIYIPAEIERVKDKIYIYGMQPATITFTGHAEKVLVRIPGNIIKEVYGSSFTGNICSEINTNTNDFGQRDHNLIAGNSFELYSVTLSVC